MNIAFKHYPLIIFDAHLMVESRAGEVTHELITALEAEDMSVIKAASAQDALDLIAYSSNIIGLVLDWDSFADGSHDLDLYLTHVKKLNDQLPIFIMTQSHELDDTSTSMLKYEINFFWKYADTYDFMVGRIQQATTTYLTSLLPPFFKAMLAYVAQHKYVWSTPGHMGGIAFLKSPVGRLFYDFYGENIFRSDLSISVPELGSLMDHTGPHREAECFAAQTFGADHTFFVTNGTSTSNKIVMMSCAAKGDVALVDRNCHKSLQQAMTMSDVIPIYLKPMRNAYGIIGTIPLSELSVEVIRQKIIDSPLIQDKSVVPTLAVITNSTYDGLIYHVTTIKNHLAKSHIPHLHFDEAWFAYAHFHPIYSHRYAMSADHKPYHPTVFGTQSTHKLLAAFSQASMIHVKNGVKPLDMSIFNETFMMHTSTSPQYSIVASMDIATKMMEGPFGYRLLSEAMSEAIAFRQEFCKLKSAFLHKKEWFFDLWQPESVLNIPAAHTHHFMDVQAHDAKIWTLSAHDGWHGFKNMDHDLIMLDPIKVTIITPGLFMDASFQDTGIPAPVVSKFLMGSGVVDEKTSFYSMLFLFSIGVNKSKSMNLLSDLVLFKDRYDHNAPVSDVFPDLPPVYEGVRDLCQGMHEFLKRENASQLLMHALDYLPEQVMTPNAAYQHLIKGHGVELPLDQLENQVILTMLVPYPPGIPVVMPGEKITSTSRGILDYLHMLERFDAAFPGFEFDTHGIVIKVIHGKRKYFVHCLQEL